MKELSHLTEQLAFTLAGAHPSFAESMIRDIAYHSDHAGKNILFVCLSGYMTDGHSFAKEAYKRGSRVFICERWLPLPADATELIVKNSRVALAVLSSAFFDHPERSLSIIGVTGTKGKSTVCEMIYRILKMNGISAGLVGTVGAKIGDQSYLTSNTTPESYELFRYLAEMVACKTKYAVIEVSSQGIKLDRIYGISFFAAVITNLTEDHIGVCEHPNLDDYIRTKCRLFSLCRYGVFNADDTYFSRFWNSAHCEKLTYSTQGSANSLAESILPTFNDGSFGIRFTAKCGVQRKTVMLPLPGICSVENALAAFTVGRLCGVSLQNAALALGNLKIPGRFEVVKTSLSDVIFVIDYAHNGESLRFALQTLRGYSPRRLVCLFGAVGGRTKGRRREMGNAAAEYADISIITSDNPGRERPSDIIGDIEKSMAGSTYFAIPDRREAIEFAVRIAMAGDIVLLAGKGHEAYQLINGKKIPFSEKEILTHAVATLREVAIG